MLPREPEEVQAGRGGDAAVVHEARRVVEHRDVDEAVIDREAGGPDHRGGRQTRAVGEDDFRALGIDGAAA